METAALDRCAAPPAVAYAARELPPGRDLLGCLARQRAAGVPWLLDSARADGRLGCSSFAGWDPPVVLRARGRRCGLEHRGPKHAAARRTEAFEADPFDALRRFVPQVQGIPDGAPPFIGGAVVTLGYELAPHVEPVTLQVEPDLPFADLCALRVDRVLAVDHATGRASAHALGFGADEREAHAAAEAALRDLERAWSEAPPAEPRAPGPSDLAELGAGESLDVRADFDEAQYRDAVERLRDHIFAGDFYQANLTQRLEIDDPGDPWALYAALRSKNPAPFAAYLELPEGAILCSSPERFLRVGAAGEVESRPIKGTRPRSSDRLHDRALARALRASEKECAENLMIVDLVRNDLGRVCEVGSVHVPELMTIESYATVHQMVSTVRGQLRADADVVDLLRASFPPGSMTGAPKIAAIDHLARLEPVARGVYAGALGYLDARGGADLAVVIRTLLVADGRAYLQVGGGIVADSEPQAEYAETWDKARALLAALEAARKARPD